MMWNGYGMYGAWMVMMGVVSLLVVVLLIGAAFYLGRTTGTQGGQSAAERILAERLARGEITEDEYRQRLVALRHA